MTSASNQLLEEGRVTLSHFKTPMFPVFSFHNMGLYFVVPQYEVHHLEVVLRWRSLCSESSLKRAAGAQWRSQDNFSADHEKTTAIFYFHVLRPKVPPICSGDHFNSVLFTVSLGRVQRLEDPRKSWSVLETVQNWKNKAVVRVYSIPPHWTQALRTLIRRQKLWPFCNPMLGQDHLNLARWVWPVCMLYSLSDQEHEEEGSTNLYCTNIMNHITPGPAKARDVLANDESGGLQVEQLVHNCMIWILGMIRKPVKTVLFDIDLLHIFLRRRRHACCFHSLRQAGRLPRSQKSKLYEFMDSTLPGEGVLKDEVKWSLWSPIIYHPDDLQNRDDRERGIQRYRSTKKSVEEVNKYCGKSQVCKRKAYSRGLVSMGRGLPHSGKIRRRIFASAKTGERYPLNVGCFPAQVGHSPFDHGRTKKLRYFSLWLWRRRQFGYIQGRTGLGCTWTRIRSSWGKG